MDCKLPLCLLLSVIIIVKEGKGYAYIGRVDTKDGYCQLQNFGRVKVGDHAFNDTRCEEAYCGEGQYQLSGCGVLGYDKNLCKLFYRSGNYPICCPTVSCVEDPSNSLEP